MEVFPDFGTPDPLAGCDTRGGGVEVGFGVTFGVADGVDTNDGSSLVSAAKTVNDRVMVCKMPFSSVKLTVTV